MADWEKCCTLKQEIGSVEDTSLPNSTCDPVVWGEVTLSKDEYVHEYQRMTKEFEWGKERRYPVMEEGRGIEVLVGTEWRGFSDGIEEKVVAQFSPTEEVDVMAAERDGETGGCGTPKPQGDVVGIRCDIKERTAKYVTEEMFEEGSAEATITREEKEEGMNSLDDEGDSQERVVGKEQNGLAPEGLSRETAQQEADRGENKEEDGQYNRGQEAGMKVSPKRKRGRKRRRPAKRQQVAEGKKRCYWWKNLTTLSRVVSLSNYQSLLFIFLACGIHLSQCLPTGASQRGMNSSLITFACRTQGCAANVTRVWCNLKSVEGHIEVAVYSQTNMPDCIGFPKHKDVCKHGGRAFVFVYEDESCEMEGNAGFIEINKTVVDPRGFIKPSTNSTPSPPPEGNNHTSSTTSKVGPIVGGLCGGVAIVGGLYLAVKYIVKKRRKSTNTADDPDVSIRLKEQNGGGNINGVVEESDSDVDLPLKSEVNGGVNMENNGVNRERTCADRPVMNGGNPLPQPGCNGYT